MRKKYSFKEWCNDNNRQDLLDRWDYDANDFNPEDITYASAKPVYFKCPNGKHDSEARKVHVITCGSQKNFICKECNKEWNKGINDLRGQKFGELTVIDLDKDRTKETGQAYWLCFCSCGKTKSVIGPSLRNGSIVTCGDRKTHWSGEKSSNWRGGVTEENTLIRNSQVYDNWREIVLKKDNYQCLVCGSGHNLESHHIYPFSDFKKLRFDVRNGITLCHSHHSMYEDGSFHKVYGTYHNTPQQLEEYINKTRTALGITTPFNIYDYMGDLQDPTKEPIDFTEEWSDDSAITDTSSQSVA